MAVATWTGKTGTWYHYEVYNILSPWNDVPGNYIFARQTLHGWVAVYIGETESLKSRLTPYHHKMQCALRSGMTHIHAHRNDAGADARRWEERDILAGNPTPCNE